MRDDAALGPGRGRFTDDDDYEGAADDSIDGGE